MTSSRPIAVIVGAGPGLGASLAKRFATGGYAIGLIARSENSILATQKDLEIQGHSAFSVTADAGEISSLKNAFKTLREKLGNDPEVLVYNASRFEFGSILDLKPEEFQATLNMSAVGALVAAQEVLPSMIKNRKGTILFTGATASLRCSAKFASFGTSKFALRALAQSMAREFGPQGIHVAHIVIDGQINTPDQVKNQPELSINSFLNSDAIAETYWQLHTQPITTWTQELDLRPAIEEF